MEEKQEQWSRRKFMTAVSAAGTAIALNPMLSWAVKNNDPVADIVARSIGIDTHNHIDVPLTAAELPGPKVELVTELKKSGLSAICMTFAVDYLQPLNEGDAYKRFITGLDAMDNLLKDNSMKRSMDLANLKAAHKKHKPAVIQSVEGAHFLEGKIDRLKPAYDRGLRVLGLLHDNDASVPLGDIYTKTAQWGGLTSFGADVIKECNRLGILVDLTHCSNKTIDDAIKVATKPFMISHTGLNTQLGENAGFAKMMLPRLISKEQAKIVSNAGAVIGVWTHLAETPAAYAENIKAMVDVVGVDHVCIGTDTKMTPSYNTGGNFGPKPGDRRDENKNNDNNKSNGPDGKKKGRAGERTNEVWQDKKEGFYYTVVDAMLKAGFKEDEIIKIGGGNFCRIFDAATTGR